MNIGPSYATLCEVRDSLRAAVLDKSASFALRSLAEEFAHYLNKATTRDPVDVANEVDFISSHVRRVLAP